MTGLNPLASNLNKGIIPYRQKRMNSKRISTKPEKRMQLKGQFGKGIRAF
jgi:hypothetical protein